MQNPRLAARYAKSLLDLSVERNSLEAILKDMQLLAAICAQSREFEVMLRSPVIKGDKKLSVIKAVLQGKGVEELTSSFIALLVNKGRELNLPEIAKAFIEQYNVLKHIRTVKITTAAPLQESARQAIVQKVVGALPHETINLKVMVDESLIGGFVLETEDKLYDASVKKALNDIKTKLIDYSYVNKM